MVLLLQLNYYKKILFSDTTSCALERNVDKRNALVIRIVLVVRSVILGKDIAEVSQ